MVINFFNVHHNKLCKKKIYTYLVKIFRFYFFIVNYFRKLLEELILKILIQVLELIYFEFYRA